MQGLRFLFQFLQIDSRASRFAFSSRKTIQMIKILVGFLGLPEKRLVMSQISMGGDRCVPATVCTSGQWESMTCMHTGV